jgi:hypothetical protein
MTKNQKKLSKLLKQINTTNYFKYVAYFEYADEERYSDFGIIPRSQETYYYDFEKNKSYIQKSCIILYKHTRKGLKRIWKIKQKDIE